jgi:phage terminase small subunit
MTRRKEETRTKVPMPSLPEDVLERVAQTPRAGKRGQMQILSPKEWAFVQEYVTRDGTMTRTEAAIRAGYTPNAARTAVTRLLDPVHSPHVIAAVNELRSELSEKYGTNFERHMRDLQKIRDKAMEAGAWSAAVQAEYRRGQALGTIYVDRKEVRIGTIDSMSKEEVMRKLDEIKKIYGGPPPTAILEMNATVVEDEIEFIEPKVEFNPDDFIETDELGEGRHATKKRTEAFRSIKAELAAGAHDADRDKGQSGNTRLNSSDPEFVFRAGRVEGS